MTAADLVEMRIATLQFGPHIGEVEANIARADRLINEAEKDGRLDGVDLLVGPEMAMTGKVLDLIFGFSFDTRF